VPRRDVLRRVHIRVADETAGRAPEGVAPASAYLEAAGTFSAASSAVATSDAVSRRWPFLAGLSR